MAGAMVVQVLIRKTSSCGRDRSGSGNVTVNQERDMIGVLGECLQHVLTARDHLERVIRRNVGREQFRLTGFILCAAHGIGHQRYGFFHWCE